MNKLKRYTIIGFFLVSIAGSLLHFVYEWSGNQRWIGYFSPVNESVWEHMKLCFFPMCLFSFFTSRKQKEEYPCISSALPAGILLSTYLIPVIFYTYSGILGKNYTFLDISTFILCVLFGFLTIYRVTLSCKLAPFSFFLKFLVFFTAVCFFLFTYYPPNIGIFLEP